ALDGWPPARCLKSDARPCKTVRRSDRPCLWLTWCPAFVLAVIGAGCGSTSTIVITESHATAPGPFERLAGFVSLPRNGDRGVYHGFQKAMPGELAACAVESSIVAGMPQQRDEVVPAPDSSRPFGAQLIVRARYTEHTTIQAVNQYGQVVNE